MRQIPPPPRPILRSGAAGHGAGAGGTAAPQPPRRRVPGGSPGQRGELGPPPGRGGGILPPQRCFPGALLRAEISMPCLARRAWRGSGEGSGFSSAVARFGLGALEGKLCAGSSFSLPFPSPGGIPSSSLWQGIFPCQHPATLPVQGGLCPGKGARGCAGVPGPVRAPGQSLAAGGGGRDAGLLAAPAALSPHHPAQEAPD